MTKKIEKSAKRFALFLVEKEKYDIIKRGLCVGKSCYLGEYGKTDSRKFDTLTIYCGWKKSDI